ncbi:MAG: N-acetylmuramoyl-L-alanine amidase [Clostridia bacterium]|nr:N-acetylmuramoyl-L-alanine amidase [Clostridia bacterium]
MSKKIYISPSNQVGNTYATGGTNEKEQCHKIAKYCVSYLKKKGFSVKCTYNLDMYERVKESNSFGADLHVAIHTNATAKHNVTGGSQILLYNLSGERKKVGQAVLDRLAPITPGKSAERLIEKPDFYEINSAKGITVYCECEFHDTKEGSDFIRKNTKAIGEAIAKGICDYYGVSTAEKNNASSENETLYSVQVGSFKSKKNAQGYVEKLKKAGFEGFIVKSK